MNNDSFLQKVYNDNTDILKFEILLKDFKQIHDFLRVFEKKIITRQIFNIKVSIEINWKDKSCKF